MIDLTKPLYVDGVRVYPIKLLHGKWPLKGRSGKMYVNVTNVEGTYENISTFYLPDGEGSSTNSISGRLSNSPNGEEIMLDFNKPLVWCDKEAKVVHTFQNGSVVVVVEGETKVRNFTLSGYPLDSGICSCLRNKTEITYRFANLMPYNGGQMYTSYVHSSLESAKIGIVDETLKKSQGFRVKQTLEDGKIIKIEIVE